MKKIFTSFFLCSFLLVACNQEYSIDSLLAYRGTEMVMKEEVSQDFIPRVYNIVSVGDSLTQGVGDSTKRGGYLPYLEKRLEGEKGVKDAVLYNFGVSGNRTSQLLDRLKTKEVKSAIETADLVIITTGGNDIMKVVKENFSRLDIEDFDQELIHFENSLTSVIDTIRKGNPEAMIGLIGLYNPFYLYFSDVKEMDLVMDKWNKVSQSILAKYEHTIFVDIAEDFRSSEENLLHTDYFHPNDKGYEIMADRTFAVLQEEALDKMLLAAKKENELNEE